MWRQWKHRDGFRKVSIAGIHDNSEHDKYGHEDGKSWEFSGHIDQDGGERNGSPGSTRSDTNARYAAWMGVDRELRSQDLGRR
jgi:hypothetical protein